MLVSMKEMLEDARRNHYALPAFDVSNYDPKYREVTKCPCKGSDGEGRAGSCR